MEGTRKGTQSMSPERILWNARVDVLAADLPNVSEVRDVGVSGSHSYRAAFARQRYQTIDREPKKRPDILLDLEGPIPDLLARTADVVLCNGVTETCGNPFALVRGVRAILKPHGRALFGVMLAGYPIGEKADLTRFTPAGAVHLVETAGFRVLSVEQCRRGDIPSYAFLLCRG